MQNTELVTYTNFEFEGGGWYSPCDCDWQDGLPLRIGQDKKFAHSELLSVSVENCSRETDAVGSQLNQLR